MVLGKDVTASALADWRTAPISDKLRAAIATIEKLTLEPAELTARDATLLNSTGVSHQGVIDLVYVCAGFNIITRIVDAFGSSVPSDQVFSKTARILLVLGYKTLSGFYPADFAARLKRQAINGNRYAADLERLVTAVVRGPGHLSLTLREAIYADEDLPDPLRSYVIKVTQRAYDTTDEDINVLKRGGYSEDQIFEATITAALGAGLRRLHIGLKVLAA